MSVAAALKTARANLTTKRVLGTGRFAENSNALGRMGFHASTYHHLEQYRRYRGYTYSIVRTIANRCSGQMIRVARKDATHADSPANGTKYGNAPKHMRRKLWKPWKNRLPLHLKGRENNLRLYRTHPIIECLANPNPIMVGSILMYVTVASIQITGKGIWWMTRNEETGKPEIWVLPSHWCEPVHTEKRLFDHWRVQPDGAAPFLIANEDVVYFYLPDISDPLAAYGPADALNRTIQVDEQTEETQRRSLLNSINPALAITVGSSPGDSPIGSIAATPALTKAQRKSIKAILRQEYQGAINADEPIILDAFIKDVKQIRATPREIDFMNTSDAVKKRLSQGWGVNPISMGEVESASRNSSSVADDHLCNNVINPLLAMMSQTMTCQMPRFFTGRTDEVVYIEEAVAKDIDYNLQVETAMVSAGAMTRNEWRERHDLPPLPYPEMDKPNAIQVAGQPSVQQTNQRTADNVGDDDLPIDVNAEGDNDNLADENDQGGNGKSTPNGRIPNGTWAKLLGTTGIVRMWVKQHDDYRKTLATALTAKLRTLGHAAMVKFNEHTPSNPADAALCVDVKEWAKQLAAACIPILKESAERAATTEWVLYRAEKSKEPLPGRIAGMVKKFVLKITRASVWKNIAVAVATAVGKAVGTAVANKTSATAAAQSVLTSTVAITKRAAAVSDEYVESAVNAGKDAAYTHLVATGRVRGRKWHNPMDGRERPTHHAAHGQVAYGNDPFIVGGYECQYPKDSVLPNKEKCGCRCTTINIV